MLYWQGRGKRWNKDNMFVRNADVISFISDQFQATGGNFAKLFDVQNKKFITISCKYCGYTELYRAETGMGMNILDFFSGD